MQRRSNIQQQNVREITCSIVYKGCGWSARKRLARKERKVRQEAFDELEAFASEIAMQEKCQEAFDELEALAREIPMLRNAKVIPKP